MTDLRGATVRLSPVRPADMAFLIGMGFDPGLIGRQYHWAEAPLQLFISPARALKGPFATACVVWVDDRRAGYIGCNPLSGNYEYVLRPWARSGGVGRRMIIEFLGHHRDGDKSRAFVVSWKNERSFHALIGALAELGWVEGTDYEVIEQRMARAIKVRPG